MGLRWSGSGWVFGDGGCAVDEGWCAGRCVQRMENIPLEERFGEEIFVLAL
jgi:hypothetical protein